MPSSRLPHQVGEESPLIEGRVARSLLLQQLVRVCCLLFVIVGILSMVQLLTQYSLQEQRINLDELQKDADGNLDSPDASANDASNSCHTMAQAVMVGCGVVVGTAIAVPAAIAIAGFSAGGVVAGSAAAAWQATVGNVVARCLRGCKLLWLLVLLSAQGSALLQATQLTQSRSRFVHSQCFLDVSFAFEHIFVRAK
jgi:hypothetical protein